jgi:hypothetical protein
MDTSRFTARTGFTPAYSSRSAVAEFAASAPPGLLNPARVDEALSVLRRLLGDPSPTGAGSHRG